VLAIKQTLYRTSGDSPIVDALIDAAEAGKQVLALVEIKARFDEQNNISWARKLEQAGVHVVYGIVGLKTHCKLSLVVRQEADGLRRYSHVGTGNYHPKTARMYTDLGLLTADPEVGQDLTRLFNQLSGYAPKSRFHRLLVAPRSVRAGLVERIEREADAARAGEPAWIKIKVNSMVDEATIDALYRASQAGASVDLVVRGICALRPGVPGLSENIRVRSILGRFLEHSRIFAFANSVPDPDATFEGTEVYIGSADLMHRNLDRRVEALLRIADRDQVNEIVDLVDESMDDGTSSWHLEQDGTWVRHSRGPDGLLMDQQEALIQRQRRRPGTGR
jgi:polyphosphate kinase